MKKSSLEKINKARQLNQAWIRAIKPKKFGILAFDPATKCGVAWQVPGCGFEFELWDLSRKANESDGLKWMRFRAKINELCSKHQIGLIAYERPAGQHKGALIHHAKLAAIIEEEAERLNINCKAYSAGQIKNMATGNGTASKIEMVKAAHLKLLYTGTDDNIADALWLLHLAKSEV